MTKTVRDLKTSTLLGRAFNTAPSWRFARTKWTVSIIPRKDPFLFQIVVLVGTPVMVVAMTRPVTSYSVMIIGGVIGAIAWTALRHFYRVNQHQEDYFVFRLADGIVELPRYKASIPASDRKAFEVLVDDRLADVGIELNFLTRAANGTTRRFPLVACSPVALRGTRLSEVDQIVKTLSSALRIPIRRQSIHGNCAGPICERCGADFPSNLQCCAECGSKPESVQEQDA